MEMPGTVDMDEADGGGSSGGALATVFFAPTADTALDNLLDEYRATREKLIHLSNLVLREHGDVMAYFINAATDHRSGWAPRVDALFAADKAIEELNASYWTKALALTNVRDLMPQARRSEWDKQIIERKTPEFDEATVKTTIATLLGQRAQFFSERIDGIFRGLSGVHATNAPEGFGRRMIVANVLDTNGWANHEPCGRINDLRCVIARFMGRQELPNSATSSLAPIFKNNMGKWMTLDGGSIRIKVFKKGTAHIEVHPEMAWRLNKVLAMLYPMAIPSQHRKRPQFKIKNFNLMENPLPFPVMRLIGSMKPARTPVIVQGQITKWADVPNTWAITDTAPYGATDSKAARQEATAVLTSLGGVQVSGKVDWFEFDYNPQAVFHEITASGCIPDSKSHQFYPTRERLARLVIEEANIVAGEECLEPSAGTAGIAELMPKDQTLCIDVARLFVDVLKAKGHNAIEADFLAWAAECANTQRRFDKILMNPPYSEGRWQAHTNAAATLLKPGGRLVAILPASAPGKFRLTGCELHWSQAYEDEFAGTSIRVVVLTADRIP